MYAILNLHLQLYKMHRENTNFNVWLQKLSIPPPWKGFFVRPPHLSGNSSQASYIYLTFWAFENPPPPRNFQSLLWGKYGCFLDLHNPQLHRNILKSTNSTLFVWNRSTVSKTCCPWGIAVVSIHLKICCLDRKQL